MGQLLTRRASVFSNLKARASAAILGVLAVVGTASAVPALIEKVNGDSLATLYIPNPQKLDETIAHMATLFNAPIDFRVADMKREFGPIADHLRFDAPLAVTIKWAGNFVDEAGNKRPGGPVLGLFIPVKNYAAAMTELKAVKAGELDSVVVEGNTLFLRNVGDNYALVSNTESVVAGFKPGAAGSVRKTISASADKITDSSSALLLVNFDANREFLAGQIDFAVRMMGRQMGDRGVGESPTVKWATDLIKKETRTLVIATTHDGYGSRLDFVPTFNEGSRLAKVSSFACKSNEFMARVPLRNYLFAGAMDFSNPEWRKLMAEMPKPEMPKDEENPAGAEHAKLFHNIFANARGGSLVMGFSPGGIGAGLLNQSVIYYADEPGKSVYEDISKLLTTMPQQVGKAKITKDAADVSGKKVDRFEITLASQNMQPEQAQIAGFLFGGTMMPSGYMAKTGTGMYMTMSRSSELMGAALAAESGGGFTADAKVRKVAERLPAGRSFELYVGAKGIIDTAVPLIKMFAGRDLKVDMKEPVAPLAFAMGGGDGSVHMSVYLPDETVKAFMDFTKAMKFGGGEDDGAPAGEPVPAEKK